MRKIKAYWKAIIAGLSLALVILTALPSLLGDRTPQWVPVAIGVLGTFFVWYKKNEKLFEGVGLDRKEP